jgi:hypothetical protein
MIEQLQKPLTADEIDFRVQSINKGGYATILAYKDARADMKRLDEVFGLKWQRDYKQVGSIFLCGVSIKVDDEWITKWDTGTESNAEAVKGLASDAFKRACFNLGIGRELYDYPVIQIKLNPNEFTVDGSKGKATWELRLKDWRWYTEFDGKELTYISAVSPTQTKYVNRFTWGKKASTNKEAT